MTSLGRSAVYRVVNT